MTSFLPRLRTRKPRKPLLNKEKVEGHEPFFEPVKRLSLKTMEDMEKKVKINSDKNKIAEYRQQGTLLYICLIDFKNQNYRYIIRYL